MSPNRPSNAPSTSLSSEVRPTGLTLETGIPICQTELPLDWYQEEFRPYAEDYLALLRSIKRDDSIDTAEFWARVAVGSDDGGLGVTQAMPAIVQATAGPPGDHLWPVLPWNGDQEAILARTGWGESTVLEAPVGTGKTQTIVNLASAAQARGSTLLVVSDRREGLEEVYRRLESVGLAEGAAIVLDPALDRENVYRAVRKRLRSRPTEPTGGDALAAREVAVESLAVDGEWFDSVHAQLVGDGGPRAAFTCYVRRLGRPRLLEDELIASLPAVEPDELDALLLPIPAYCEARLKTLLPTESVPKRPTYAGRTRADLEGAISEMLPAIKGAIQDAREWADSEDAPGITVEAAAGAGDALRELLTSIEEAPPLGHAAWASVETARRWLASPAAARADADPVEADARRVERYLERRTKAGGKFLRAPPADWDTLKEDLDAWDGFEEDRIRVINPNFYAVKKRLQEALRRERLNAEDVGKGVRRLKRRLGLGRSVRATAGGLAITTLDPHALRTAPDDALRAAVHDAGAALEFVRLWSGVPEKHEDIIKVALPKTRAQHDAQVARIRHALAAPRVHQGIVDAKARLEGWIGASAVGWVDFAFQQNRPKLVDGWFDAEVAVRFDALAEADELVQKVESAHEELADLARRLAEGGDSAVQKTLAAAYAERWLRDAEALAPELLEFNEGADRRRRKRLNEATTTLEERGAEAVHERIAARLRTLPESVKELEEYLNEAGRSPRLATVVERFWERGLKTLVPVWLCSPEAVSAGLPLDSPKFDVIVFDEADGLAVERAVPAAKRARAALVLGDSRRTPPAGDDSLLRRARAVYGASRYTLVHGAVFPHLTDARRNLDPRGLLRSAPLFHPRPKPPTIELIRIAGQWTRRGNATEADAAAELLGQLLEAAPERSIAIITGSATQRDCVLARIRRRGLRSRGYRATVGAARERAPGLQAIVRSVDDLRGEARDVVIFAPGVAKDADGSVAGSLGNLGADAAPRLLEAAAAAARTKTIVLSSVDPDADLADDAGASPLRRYLSEAVAWTRGGRRVLTPRVQDPSVDALANSIVQALEGMGYPCERDVGATDLRVDIAVRDSVRPRPFLMAILLDGPTASWATGARLREHSRWALLRDAGWPVTSVSAWSWLHHRAEIKERLKIGLEKSATGNRPRPLRPPAIGPMPSGAIEE